MDPFKQLVGSVIAIDTETTGLLPWGDPRTIVYDFGAGKKKWTERRTVYPARPFAFSFSDLDGNTAYVRWEVEAKTRRVLPGAYQKSMAALLADESITKIGHNVGYDLRMLEKSGFEIRGPVYDTMILAHIMTSGQELTYALKPLAKRYLDIDDGDEKTLKVSAQRARATAKRLGGASYATNLTGGRDPVKADYWMADPDLCETYAVQDAVRCAMFWLLWYDELQADRDARDLFQREHDLFWTLKRMEDRGVRVYPHTVRMLKWYYEAYRKKQLREAAKHGGAGLNFKSVPQMTDKFYRERGHTPAFTENGNWSLNGEKLLELANGIKAADETWITPPDPLAKAVLEYNAAGQTINSFLDVYERYWVKEIDGYILHPNFKQTGTITGRLSCSDPNLMQVASATTGRRKADIQSRPREAFGPRDGYLWYLPDYSQIEVWLFATLSGEQKMLDALMSGRDFHGTISEQVFGRNPDFAENKSYYRKCAKLIMFAKLYGGGLKKLASLLKMDLESAKRFIERYEAELPGVATFMQRMITRATRDRVIRNPFGRKYSFDPSFAYKSVNYLIQGTAADVMKNALVNVDRMLRSRWPGVYLLLTIHDEIVIEVPRRLHSKRLMKEIIEAMQLDSTRLGVPVPLPVGMKIAAHRWHRTHEIDLAA